MSATGRSIKLRENPVPKTYKESQTALLYLFPGKIQNVFLFPSNGDPSSGLRRTPRTGLELLYSPPWGMERKKGKSWQFKSEGEGGGDLKNLFLLIW